MNGSRLPGLVLPVVFLLALVVGLCWYWRHGGDE
jgi:NADH:ubiquinone oxidoreductase subunit 3 (subunit A)